MTEFMYGEPELHPRAQLCDMLEAAFEDVEMELDTITTSCGTTRSERAMLPIGDDPEAVVIGRPVTHRGATPTGDIWVRVRDDIDESRTPANMFEVYFDGAGVHVAVMNGSQLFRPVRDEKETDIRIALALAELKHGLEWYGIHRRNQETHADITALQDKAGQGRIARLLGRIGITRRTW